MLRTRDLLATTAILWLSRMAWRDPAESLSANVFLSWYIPQNHIKNGQVHATPMLFDVDGDQKPETLAVMELKDGQWVLQVVDLKPSGSTDKTHLAPFRPKVLYESQPIVIDGETATRPLALTTGHVDMLHKAAKKQDTTAPSADRTRHYFCGADWHDAASKCGVHCPKGQSEECPEGERCYADTPCDAQEKSKTGALDDAEVHYTASGGIPSIFVLWGSGSVTMHSLTAPKGTLQKLHLEQQWTMSSTKDLNRTMSVWDDASLDFLDSIDTDTPGMLILTGYVDYKRVGKEHEESATVTIAIDAKTGKIVWDHYHLDHPEPREQPPVLPMHRGVSSGARRRSMIPSLEEGPHLFDTRGNVNCLHAYRRSLLTSGVLPYMYTDHSDAGVQLAHFTHHERPQKVKGKDKIWKRKKAHRRKAHLGKPNVVVSRNFRGLHVRSLKNGKSVCHLSLWDNSLYADLNHDGVLDTIQAITGETDVPSETHNDDDEYSFYDSLLRKMGTMDDKESEKEMKAGRLTGTMNLCHLMALSGVPNKEELFTINMCSGQGRGNGDDLGPTTIMALEAAKGRGYDGMLYFSLFPLVCGCF